MINKNNVVAQLKDYDAKSPNKSIVALILSETMSDKGDQREALIGEGTGKSKIMGIYTLLLEHAKDAGVDAQTLEIYKKDFEKALDKELSKVLSSLRFDSTKLDTLMEALIQTIDNVKTTGEITDRQINIKGGGSASKIQTDAYNLISKRFNQAQKDFNAQLKEDGWAGDVADAFGKIYGSKNTADKVRADLKTVKGQCNELNAALKEGDGAFRAKFKEIFGIPYQETNIKSYQKAEATYLEAAKVKAQEDYFANHFALLLNGKPLAEESQMVTQSVSAGTMRQVLSASKADVYNREFNKLANLIGDVGANNLNEIIKATVGENASIDKKYEVLQKFAQNTFEGLQSNTKKACGGRSFDSVQKTYDNTYKAAYGVENDIMKRVADYNLSQQKGAGVVKAVGITALTIAGTMLVVGSGGTAAPAVAMLESAAIATAAPVAVELTDRASSGKALDKLREGNVSDYLKTVNDDVDWSNVTKTAMTNGALTIMFMGQSYAVANLCKAVGASAVTTGVANAAGTIATGLGTEYLMTGEISVEGSIFVVTMAVVGGVMTVKSIKAAEAAQSKAMAEQHAADIHSAREALGFAEGQEITAEGLKAQYKKLSIEAHPDLGGSNVRMAEINNAYDFLTKNIADLNIKAPAVKPGTPVPKTQSQSPDAWLKDQGIEFKRSYIEYDPTGADGHIIFKVDGKSYNLSHYEPGVIASPFKGEAASKAWLVNFVTEQKQSGISLVEFAQSKNLLVQIMENGEWNIVPKAKTQPAVTTQTTNSQSTTTTEVGMPKNYRARFETPDYSRVRSKFPIDSYQTQTKQGKATAYTTTGEPDGIVYKGDDGKLYVPNKWSPESPHEVKPGSVIMVYDEAGGDFAVGDPTVIAKTYRNAANEIDPLYNVEPGRANAIEITKDIVPSAFKIVPEGTVVKTKEAPGGVTVKEGQAVMYDIDGDPYVVDIQKTLLKRQEPVDEAAKTAMKSLKETGKIPQLTTEQKLNFQNKYFSTVEVRPNEISPGNIVDYAYDQGLTVEVYGGKYEDPVYALKNAQGQIVETYSKYGTNKMIYGQDGVIEKSVEYDLNGNLISVSHFAFQDDSIIVTKLDCKYFNNVETTKCDSSGRHVKTPSGGDFKTREFTEAEISELQALDKRYEASLPKNANMLSKTPEQMADMFAPPKKGSRSLLSYVEDPHTSHAQRVYKDLDGNVVKTEKIHPGDNIIPQETYYDKDGNVIVKRYYNYSDMTSLYKEEYFGSNGKLSHAGEFKNGELTQIQEWNNGTYTTYDASGKAVFQKTVQNGVEIETKWSEPLNRYVTTRSDATGVLGVKSKQSAPSQKLPKFINTIYGDKAGAEGIVFGNGTLADIDSQIVQNATKELSNYLGREIKPNDLQVVKTSNGAYISYFDNETNLATHFTYDGELNGQFKINFDDQGNIQSYGLATIYYNGKFVIYR